MRLLASLALVLLATPVLAGPLPTIVTLYHDNGDGTQTPLMYEQNGAAVTLAGAAVTEPYAPPSADWHNQQSLTDASSHQVVAAGAAGVKNYITAMQVSTLATTTAVTLSLLSGATVLWTGDLQAGAFNQNIVFPTPLPTVAATALNVQLSGSPTGAVAFNAQGYSVAD